MEPSKFFLDLLVIIAAAKIAAELFSRVGLAAVLGEVAAGVLIGPGVLGIVAPEPQLYLIAEIGILLLLFEIGLETDVAELTKAGGAAALTAVTGVAAPAVMGYFAGSLLLGLQPAASFFLGGTLTATSIGITMRVFSDLKKTATKTARVVLGAAVLDDIIGVAVLAAAYDIGTNGHPDVYGILRLCFFIALFLVAAPVAAGLLMPLISRLTSAARTRGAATVVIMALILFLAVLAGKVGAPAIFGSFAAGIALTGTFRLPFGLNSYKRAENIGEKSGALMKPLTELFVPVFFVMVGMSVDFKTVDFGSGHFMFTCAALVAVSVVSKLLSGLWIRGDFRQKLAVGVAMIPRGEVGLIFAEVGRKSGIFDGSLYAGVVFTVFMTTLAAPLLLKPLMGERKV